LKYYQQQSSDHHGDVIGALMFDSRDNIGHVNSRDVLSDIQHLHASVLRDEFCDVFSMHVFKLLTVVGTDTDDIV